MRCGDYLKNIVTNGWWINDLPARYRNTDKCDIDRAMCYGVCDAVFIRRQIRPESEPNGISSAMAGLRSHPDC